MERFRYRLFRLVYFLRRWLTRRFTPSGWAVLACLFISAVAGADTRQTLAYQIFAFLLSVLGISVIYSFFWHDHFTVQRTLPQFGSVGTNLQYRIVVYNHSPRPQTGLKLFENFPDPPIAPRGSPPMAEFKTARNVFEMGAIYYGWLWSRVTQFRAKIKAVDVPPIPPRGRVEVRIDLQPRRRGAVQLTGVTLARPDPFGLFYACRTLPLPDGLWILPQRYPLPPIQLPGARHYQSGGVALATAVGDSEEFRALRDYHPGDPLRKIHWKSWAKVGQPIVREEQDEFFVRHALILDTFQTNQPTACLEAALSVAASFACEIQTQESLLDLMFVGADVYCFTAGRGVGHTDQLLKVLAAVEACQDKSFEDLMPIVLNQSSILSGCICVLLTWDESRQRLVETLRGFQLPTLVLVVTEDRQSLIKGLDSDTQLPHDVRVLELDKLEEGLLQL